MAGPRLRAFQNYGTTSNLRASLAEFGSSGGGFCTSFVPAAQSRLHGITQDLEEVRACALDKAVARLLTLAGGGMLPLADGIQQREALARACLELPPESPFYASREFPGLVRRLAGALEQLRLWRLDGEEMLRVGRECDAWLCDKLVSLAFLDNRLRRGLLSAARELESERLERCLGLQLQAESRQRLWVYAGAEYAPLWADWLMWAASNGVEVWVVVDGRTGMASECRGARMLLDHLRVTASPLGSLNGLAEGLFSEQPRLDTGIDTQIWSVADPLAEVEWALRELKEKEQEGLPWSRAAIYVRNLQDYAPLLESAAERFDVPVRMAHRDVVAHNGWIRLLRAFLGACANSTPVGLRPLASSSYLALPEPVASNCRSIVNVSLASEEPWTDLYGRLSPEAVADTWLRDAVRLHGKSELGALSFREWYDELKELMESDWLALSSNEDSTTKRRDVAARSALLHALEQRTSLGEAADETVSLSGFLAELRRICETTECGWIGEEEGLAVVSDAYALGSVQALCVLGMVEGTFPRRRSENPILSDAERRQIDSIRPEKPPLPNSHDAARAERDELVRLCAATAKDLYLFYPQVGEDRDNTPAFYLEEVRRVSAGACKEVVKPSAWLTPEPDAALFEADLKLSQALAGPKTFAPEPELVTEAAREVVSGMPLEGASPRELADSLRCSFQFVFKRKLGLFPGRTDSKWYRLRFLPEAAGLTVSPDASTAERTLLQALESELEELGPELEPSERHLLEHGARREIRGWVDREFISRQIWRERETDWQAGVAFGEYGTADELPLNGERIKLRGRLAGVGDLRDYAVGQLYGGRSFGAGRSLDKIEDPDLLELGVYVWSLCKRRKNVALEVDTTAGERLLLVLPKPDAFDIESRVNQGLRVVELGDKQEFFERVKELLAVSTERIRSGTISTRSDEHCRYCDYGELCRRAHEFGEQVDPFETEPPVVC